MKKPTGKAIGTGVLTDGRVTWTTPISFTNELKALGNGHVSVTVKLETAAAIRSAKANAYYWSCVLTPMSEDSSSGDASAEDIHDAMCERFLPNETKRVAFFNRMTGEELTIETDDGRRSSKLKGDDFYQFVEKVRKFALEFMGLTTQDPDPEYWRVRRAA